MIPEELINKLTSFPDNCEVLVDIGDRYAEIKDAKLEYSQRVNERKPYAVIHIYQ